MFKRFKDKEKFINLVNEFKVQEGTIILKLNIFKLCKKYPKLLKSSTGLEFLKIYCKDINKIFSENAKEFS